MKTKFSQVAHAKCVGLAELPAVAGKSGWPWDEACSPLPEQMPNGEPWPRITVVTPSYNQVEFLEKTLRSVLLQGYPNLEYIVIDGGSTDQSPDIIRRYAPWLAHWESEPDRGQSHALNKGFARATGEIRLWLNSDDVYLPNALEAIALKITALRERAILFGDATLTWPDGEEMHHRPPDVDYSRLLFQSELYRRDRQCMPCQPSVAWHAALQEAAGPLREDLDLAMDHDFWLRMLEAGGHFRRLDQNLAIYRFHDASKSGRGFDTFESEWRTVQEEHLALMSPGARLRQRAWLWREQILGPNAERRRLADSLLQAAMQDPRRSERLRLTLVAAAKSPAVVGTRPWWLSLWHGLS
jgi:GT2 family glycosyltransferase